MEEEPCLAAVDFRGENVLSICMVVAGFSSYSRDGTFCLMAIILDSRNMSLNKFPNMWAVNLEVLQVAFMGGRKLTPTCSARPCLGPHVAGGYSPGTSTPLSILLSCNTWAAERYCVTWFYQDVLRISSQPLSQPITRTSVSGSEAEAAHTGSEELKFCFPRNSVQSVGQIDYCLHICMCSWYFLSSEVS